MWFVCLCIYCGKGHMLIYKTKHASSSWWSSLFWDSAGCNLSFKVPDLQLQKDCMNEIPEIILYKCLYFIFFLCYSFSFCLFTACILKIFGKLALKRKWCTLPKMKCCQFVVQSDTCIN